MYGGVGCVGYNMIMLFDVILCGRLGETPHHSPCRQGKVAALICGVRCQLGKGSKGDHLEPLLPTSII